MKTAITVRFVALGVVACLSTAVSAYAANEDTGFGRTDLAIGALTNKMVMTGDSKGAGRRPSGVSEAVAIEASKRLDPNQEKEMHSYLASWSKGGHTSWHSHPGLELAINPVDGAPVTFYLLNRNGSCRNQVLLPRQSLLVLPGEVHMVRNESEEVDAAAVIIRIHTGDSRQFLPVGSSTPNPDYVPVTTTELQPSGTGCPVI
jgi:quercetin dioxygenase-like cupin family protein